MARFVFEARFNRYDDAKRLELEVKQSGLECDERNERYTVAGIIEACDMEALGLRVMNALGLQEFKVNRILAEYSAADATISASTVAGRSPTADSTMSPHAGSSTTDTPGPRLTPRPPPRRTTCS